MSGSRIDLGDGSDGSDGAGQGGDENPSSPSQSSPDRRRVFFRKERADILLSNLLGGMLFQRKNPAMARTAENRAPFFRASNTEARTRQLVLGTGKLRRVYPQQDLNRFSDLYHNPPVSSPDNTPAELDALRDRKRFMSSNLFKYLSGSDGTFKHSTSSANSPFISTSGGSAYQTNPLNTYRGVLVEFSTRTSVRPFRTVNPSGTEDEYLVLGDVAATDVDYARVIGFTSAASGYQQRVFNLIQNGEVRPTSEIRSFLNEMGRRTGIPSMGVSRVVQANRSTSTAPRRNNPQDGLRPHPPLSVASQGLGERISTRLRIPGMIRPTAPIDQPRPSLKSSVGPLQKPTKPPSRNLSGLVPKIQPLNKSRIQTGKRVVIVGSNLLARPGAALDAGPRQLLDAAVDSQSRSRPGPEPQTRETGTMERIELNNPRPSYRIKTMRSSSVDPRQKEGEVTRDVPPSFGPTSPIQDGSFEDPNNSLDNDYRVPEMSREEEETKEDYSEHAGMAKRYTGYLEDEYDRRTVARTFLTQNIDTETEFFNIEDEAGTYPSQQEYETMGAMNRYEYDRRLAAERNRFSPSTIRGQGMSDHIPGLTEDIGTSDMGHGSVLGRQAESAERSAESMGRSTLNQSGTRSMQSSARLASAKGEQLLEDML